MPIGLDQWIIGITYKQVNRSNLETIYSMQDAIDEVSFLNLADFRDFTFQAGSEGEMSPNKRIHLGTEFGLFPVSDSQHLITLRMGYNQSYLTYGAEASFTRAMVLGYIEYIEETGEYAG
ncbi:MAG: hypothetical protein GY786_05210 [Proteobacteria bacterium]|nr:hypothetical protein [Pseudomonadota bacterium]